MKTWYDKVINLQLGFSGNANAATTGSECHKLVRLYLRSKKQFPVVFDESSANITASPILFYVIPYDSYGSLISDNIASISYYGRLYYKDVKTRRS